MFVALIAATPSGGVLASKVGRNVGSVDP